MITLNVKTPVGRKIHTNGHRGKSFYTAPCQINVFAGAVLLETIDPDGQVDFRIEVIAKDGNSPVDIDLVKVAGGRASAKAKAAAKNPPKTTQKTAARAARRSSAKSGRSGGAR